MFRKRRNRLTVAAQRKKERLESKLPSTQETLCFDDVDQQGLMQIDRETFSKAYELNDVAYEAVGEEQQEDVIVAYAQALNRLADRDNYQLLVVNKKVGEKAIEDLLMPLTGDDNDVYRSEINQIMQDKFSEVDNEYQAKRYAIFTTKAREASTATKDISTIAHGFGQRFIENDIDLRLDELDRTQWLNLINELTNPGKEIPVDNKHAKNIVAPTDLVFDSTDFKLNGKLTRIFWIEEYPKTLEDRLIRDLLKLNHEMAISIHAQPYNVQTTKARLKKISMANTIDIRRQQKQNFKDGVAEDMVSGYAGEIREATDSVKDALSNNTQKLFSGIFTVMVQADSKEELKTITDEVRGVGAGAGVYFDMAYKYQEEAFNTILPIGNTVMAEEPAHMRDMTTLNLATQIPFRSVELQSPHGEFFGQNQISKGLITIDRKNKEELYSPSGLITGSTGSGKSVATKYQIMNTLLNHPNDRIVIVDPESEYLPMGEAMGAEILDIATGTSNHLNILDLADKSKLDSKDRNLDLIKEKTNLLTTLLSSVINLTAGERGIIDRVTSETYERYKKPTLRDWQDVLEEQSESSVEELKNAMYPYTKGASDIFAHETNIDLSSRFLIFNTKNLDENLKPFAMKVILDQIWKEVVANQGKKTTWLYFDEIQVNFQTDEDAKWFANLWARVRKYGAIPTGITQNIITLLSRIEGQKLVSNTEFMLLLRQKGPDLKALTETMQYDNGAVSLLEQFAGRQAQKGTGIIQADGIMVPFENLIPKNTKLYELLNTDVETDNY